MAAQSAFSVPLDTLHKLISVGFSLPRYLVRHPALTSPLKPGPCPFLPCTLTTLIHHRCPRAIFMYIFYLCSSPKTTVPHFSSSSSFRGRRTKRKTYYNLCYCDQTSTICTMTIPLRRRWNNIDSSTEIKILSLKNNNLNSYIKTQIFKYFKRKTK